MKMRIEGYVAFLDILGFSKIVANDTFHERFGSYIEIIRTAVSFPGSNLEFEITSDSVVIYSSGLKLSHLKNLLSAVSTISFRLLTEIQIPVRGAISAGKYWRFDSKDGHLMFSGAPIVDAVEYEKEQSWIGILLTPKVLEQVPELQELHFIPQKIDQENAHALHSKLPWPLLVWRHEKIPFRYRNISIDRLFAGIVVVPSPANCETPAELLTNLKIYIKKLQELKLLAPYPETQQKYVATMICLEQIRKRWEKVTAEKCWLEQN